MGGVREREHRNKGRILREGVGSRTTVGLKGLVPKTQTQTSGTDYNNLTLDPVNSGCSTRPFPSPYHVWPPRWNWGSGVPTRGGGRGGELSPGDTLGERG